MLLANRFFHYYILNGVFYLRSFKKSIFSFLHISNLDVTTNVLCEGFDRIHVSSRVVDRHSWPPAIFSHAWRFKRVSPKVRFSKSFGKGPSKMFGTLGISSFLIFQQTCRYTERFFIDSYCRKI